MTRASILLSGLCLALLLAGSLLVPLNPIMWMAGTSLIYTWLRIFLIIILLVLAFTASPRRLPLRILASVVAAIVLVGTVTLTYSGDMKLLDTLSLAAAAVTIIAATLELDRETDQVDIESLRQAKRYSVHHV